MIQIENIPRGHENAVQRPANPLEDRKLRREDRAGKSERRLHHQRGQGLLPPGSGECDRRGGAETISCQGIISGKENTFKAFGDAADVRKVARGWNTY